MDNYRNSQERAESLAKLSPNDARAARDVFMSALKVGDVHRLSGRKEDALASYRRCVDIMG